MKQYQHGLYNHPLYHTWENMQQRCKNPGASGYEHYGGRGIKVCGRWSNFANFIEDMGEKPDKTYTLDRIDVNGNYTPDNCRWANKRQQSVNTRKRKDNTSGTTGVYWSKKDKRWIAKIKNPKGSKTLFTLKYFRELEDAIKYNALKRAEIYGGC